LSSPAVTGLMAKVIAMREAGVFSLKSPKPGAPA
jgi:hypothetical protein